MLRGCDSVHRCPRVSLDMFVLPNPTTKSTGRLDAPVLKVCPPRHDYSTHCYRTPALFFPVVSETKQQWPESIMSTEVRCMLWPIILFYCFHFFICCCVCVYTQASASLEKAEAAVKALQTAILEVGGERLKKAVKRADAASK